MGRLVIVTGVGTEIGKTHLAVSLVLGARARGWSVAGYKPVESGLDGHTPGDASALLAASTFRVEPAPLYGFTAPVSPHLAAEWTEQPIQWKGIVSAVAAVRSSVDLMVVELAGGLFTPLGPGIDNADLVRALEPDSVVLVAVDALGVLHHTRAAAMAAAARGLPRSHLALVEPSARDASTGHNSAPLLTSFVSIVPVARARREELARSEAIAELLEAFVR
jgi:dethiobiotin synthetase